MIAGTHIYSALCTVHNNRRAISRPLGALKTNTRAGHSTCKNLLTVSYSLTVSFNLSLELISKQTYQLYSRNNLLKIIRKDAHCTTGTFMNDTLASRVANLITVSTHGKTT